ncbi:hypothetical protein OAQ16_01170 [Flavobacteriales bacterium]|nr:hypothetical protein [Flavobacteriales bacterium]
MKKLSSILLAFFFTASFTMSAQDIADNSQKNTETKTECDSKVKETKKASGFNFTKTNTYGKANCSSSSKMSSCSKTEKEACSKSANKSSCSKSKTAKKDEASCSKTAAKSSCCKSKSAKKEVSDDSKAMNKKTSERVRLAIANNEISAEEGRVRLAKLNEKKKN